MSDRPIQIFLVDDDQIFRLGIATALEPFSDLEIIAQETVLNARDRLSLLASQSLPDVVILDPGRDRSAGWQFCQQLEQDYPEVALLLLTSIREERWLQAAQKLGIEGYCSKGVALAELAIALRRVAAGERYWPSSGMVATPEGSIPSKESDRAALPWIARQRRASLANIEADLAQVESRLTDPNLSLVDWLFWSGLRRELGASRWLIEQFVPGAEGGVGEDANGDRAEIVRPLPPATEVTPEPVNLAATPPQSLADWLCDGLLIEIKLDPKNGTRLPLALDILPAEKKRELLYTVVQNVREGLDELRFLQVSPQQLPERRSLWLQQVWQSSAGEFFGKYYSQVTDDSLPALADVFLRATPAISATTLDAIPMVAELLAFLLYEEPIAVDRVTYRARSPEARAQATVLLHNLVLRIGDAIVQVILDRFSEWEAIRMRLYQSRYASEREIARIRNNVSWRYLQEYYFEEPRAVFSEEYRLLVLREGRIEKVAIAASRKGELQQLRGIRWGVTIAIEASDALTPRLRSVVNFVGKGLVFLLKEVVGRGLGLIGSGIIQGVGSALQEARAANKRDRNY